MKRLLLFLMAVTVLAAMVFPASAATVESEIVNLERSRSIVIWVRWDREQPDVVFLAPDGTEYSPLAEREGTATLVSENNLYYTIENAAAGQWRVRYDKKGNSTLDISVHNHQQPLVIQSFTTEAPQEDSMRVTFNVSGPENKRYSYRISAMINHTGVEKELTSGSSTVDWETERTLNLNKLSTYDGYLLKLYVWYQDDGVDVADFAFSEPFAYTNTKQDADLPAFDVVVLPEEHLIRVEWADMPWGAESLLAAVFEDGGGEPAFFDEYDPHGQKYAETGYTPGASELAVEVSVKRSGVNSAPVRRNVTLSDFKLSLEAISATNSLSLPMAYRAMSSQPVTAVVNGYTTELTLDGDGTINLPLTDEWNTIQVSYTDANGITWRISREIFVDRNPPVLNMSRNYDGMHLESRELTVSGTALECDVLTVNGESVEVGEGGMFSKEVTLTEGVNTVTVVAADALGNESLYTASVVCGTGEIPGEAAQAEPDGPGSLLTQLTAEGSYWVMLITSALCLLVVGYALIFWRKEGKK